MNDNDDNINDSNSSSSNQVIKAVLVIKYL